MTNSKDVYTTFASTQKLQRRYVYLTMGVKTADNPGPPHGQEEQLSPWMPNVDTVINADSKHATAGPFGKCIYCGATSYARDSKRALGGEHVVMAGIGGVIELLEASCHSCEQATGAFETVVIRNLFEIMRRHLKLKTRAKTKTQKVRLQLKRGDRNIEVRLPFEEHPRVIAMPTYHGPALLTGDSSPNFAGIWLESFATDKQTLPKFNNMYAPSIDTARFAQFLAKIAHGYALYRVGTSAFKPSLTDGIQAKIGKTGDWTQRNQYVGGRADSYLPTAALHELTLLYQKCLGVWLLVVRVRLFANLGAPVYVVVVGEWLGGEPPADRVISINS